MAFKRSAVRTRLSPPSIYNRLYLVCFYIGDTVNKNFNKLFFCTIFLFFTLSSSFSAFFLGKDKYTDEIYLQAGIKHNRRIWWFDEYYFDGQKIPQFTAEILVYLYCEIFEQKCNENPEERKIYTETAKFISKLNKKQIKQIINFKMLKLLEKFN